MEDDLDRIPRGFVDQVDRRVAGRSPVSIRWPVCRNDRCGEIEALSSFGVLGPDTRSKPCEIFVVSDRQRIQVETGPPGDRWKSLRNWHRVGCLDVDLENRIADTFAVVAVSCSGRGTDTARLTHRPRSAQARRPGRRGAAGRQHIVRPRSSGSIEQAWLLRVRLEFDRMKSTNPSTVPVAPPRTLTDANNRFGCRFAAGSSDSHSRSSSLSATTLARCSYCGDDPGGFVLSEPSIPSRTVHPSPTVILATTATALIESTLTRASGSPRWQSGLRARSEWAVRAVPARRCHRLACPLTAGGQIASWISKS